MNEARSLSVVNDGHALRANQIGRLLGYLRMSSYLVRAVMRDLFVPVTATDS